MIVKMNCLKKEEYEVGEVNSYCSLKDKYGENSNDFNSKSDPDQPEYIF